MGYDHWASRGNPGWSYEDVLPLFKRAANNEQFKDGFHGQGGPLNVTYPILDTRARLPNCSLRPRPCIKFEQTPITTEPSKRVPSNTRSPRRTANL